MTSVYDFNRLREEVEQLRRRVEFLESVSRAVQYPNGPYINTPLQIKCPGCGVHDLSRTCSNAACPLLPKVTC